MPSEELKTRLESQLSRLICPIFSTGLSLSDFCGNGKRVMLSGTESFFETYLRQPLAGFATRPDREERADPSRLSLELVVAADQVVGRTVMAELWLGLALELGDDALGQNLAEFDAPLIEGIDVPDGALGEHAVLVERNQLSQRRRGQSVHQNGVGRPIAFEYPVRDKPSGRAFGLDLLGRFSEGERLGLRKYIRQQHIMMPAEWVERLSKSDEVTGDEPGALMDQLIEGVLAIGSRLAPIDRAGVSVHRRSIEPHMFAVALHRQLLEISRETLQVLVVGQHCDGLRAPEVVVPDAEKAHEHRQVAPKWRGPEMLVDRLETRQHGVEMLRADGQHG